MSCVAPVAMLLSLTAKAVKCSFTALVCAAGAAWLVTRPTPAAQAIRRILLLIMASSLETG